MYLAPLAFFCLILAADTPESGEFAVPVEAAAPEEGTFEVLPGDHPAPAKQAEIPVRQSRLAWMVQSLGCFYGLIIPLAGLVVFAGACLVVALSKRPALIASYLVFVPLPSLIGIFGSIQGVISALSFIGHAEPRPSDIAIGISTALFTSYAGLLASAPSYLIVGIGLFVRTLQSGKSQAPFGSSILP